MIVVSISTFNTPNHLLSRAINSVLNQTVQDLVIVVIRDGGREVDASVADDRIIWLPLSENNGTYFAHSVVIEALKDRGRSTLWKPHDADDWSEPDAVERLQACSVEGVGFSGYRLHLNATSSREIRPQRKLLVNPSPQARFPTVRKFGLAAKRHGVKVPVALRNPIRAGTHWACGLYSIDRVLLAGGIHPEFRTAYDSLFVHLVARSGRVGLTDAITYNYDRGHNALSLTRDIQTNGVSEARIQNLQRLEEMYRNNFPQQSECPASRVSDRTQSRRAFYAEELRQIMTARLGL